MDSAISIAVTSFLVGLSGAMMPGPVLTVTISETVARVRSSVSSPVKHGAVVGPLIVLGHGVLEISLIVAIMLGIGGLLTRTPVRGIIGIAGGLSLIYMAVGMFRGLKGLHLTTEARPDMHRRHPVWAGVLTSVSNPYWIFWWATIGLFYLGSASPLGAAGVSACYFGHICSDLLWYSSISCSLALGHRLLTDKVYRGLIAACAVFLLVFGVISGYEGVRFLMA